MQSIKDLIDDYADEYPHLAYYHKLIETAEENLREHPDITIETCKSLIEGVCKTILKSLDNAFDEKVVEGMKPKQLVERTFDDLSRYDESVEIGFTSQFASLVQEMNLIRNRRGDISHGRSAPKTDVSSSGFSEFILRMTENSVFYMLNIFCNIDLSEQKPIEYEEQKNFNAYLDDEISIALGEHAEGLDICYSRALYDQEPVTYEERLRNYKSEIEESDEE
ncbi:hypothetical protein PUV54_09885 [Hyphococcus flavus]|uniref:Abortive infection protein-like C-terminal domain-containing protein n=1 Tax=Hyphococcus flavus TaxID=1866326 RepID=A0AAF0CEZ4_9PROT|nr:hypothetical protein [Hyphococcus flavus]WDI30268.1 hypothetical protein PUV54_09885 [Hyphococcus flavus]